MSGKNTYGLSLRTARLLGLSALLCLLFAPALSLFARAQAVTLGTNTSNAPTITVSSTANVTDGEENYFVLQDAYLPTTVYYLPDSAFGPIPYLVDVVSGDTLESEIVFDECRMAWRWTFEQTTDAPEKTYLYFTTHETAKAEFIPTCWPSHVTLPDTAICSFFVFGDTTIYDSGDYTRHYTNVFGCDSTVSLHVDILQPSESTDNITAYDSLTWIDGNTYYGKKSGPVWTLENAAGCDSIITLNLTVRHLWRDTDSLTVCQSETPYYWRGQTLTESGMYTTDTLPGEMVDKVYQDTVHAFYLTVNPTYIVDTVVTICDTAYTWHGVTYKESGIYADSLKTVDACDSVILLHLTLTDDCFPPEEKEDDKDSCVQALHRIGECIVINHDVVEDFAAMTIQWLCDGKQIDKDVDRLTLANRAEGEYSAFLIRRDCANCDTLRLCSTEYVQGVKVEKSAMVSVNPTYVPASEPFIYLTVTEGTGKYYLYGTAGKVLLTGDFTDKSGVQKLTLPAMNGLYILICVPEGEDGVDRVVQKIKLLVY